MAGGIDYTPQTFTAGSPLLASELNTEVRDFSSGIQDQWTTWTPTWGGLTVGNGTVIARYFRVGNTVSFRLLFTAGGTSVFAGTFTFSLPVAIRNDYAAGLEGIHSQVVLVDGGSAATRTVGGAYVASAGSSTVGMIVDRLGGTYATAAVVNTTTPWTWAATDTISVTGTYEAA